MAPIPSISRAKDKEEVEGKESQAQSPYNTHTKCLVTLSRTSFIIKSVQHKGLQHGPKHIYTVDWRSFPLYFSDVNILRESERERLFCKKDCKGARVGGRDAREDCSQGGLRYQRGYPPSFPSLSLFFFSLSLLLIPAMHQLDKMCELFRSRSTFKHKHKKQVSWAPTCMCPRRASTR